MDYPKSNVISNQKEESISAKRVYVQCWNRLNPKNQSENAIQ